MAPIVKMGWPDAYHWDTNDAAAEHLPLRQSLALLSTALAYTFCVVHRKYDRDWHPEDDNSQR